MKLSKDENNRRVCCCRVQSPLNSQSADQPADQLFFVVIGRMDTSDKYAVAVLPVQCSPDVNKDMILCTDWKEESIEMQLIHRNSETFSTSVMLSDLLKQAATFEMLAEEFLTETRQCLTTNKGLDGFKYTFRDSVFSWKKTVGSLTLIYGTAKLTPKEDPDGLLTALGKIQAENRELRLETGRLRKANEELTMAHEELAKAEKTTLADVLTKCRLLLNEKKAKIRELENKLKESFCPLNDTQDDSESLIKLPPSRRRPSVNRIPSESSQPDSSEDSIPLAFLPKTRQQQTQKISNWLLVSNKGPR